MANKRARGRPPVLYEHPTTGERLTPAEWVVRLGLSGTGTFYCRLRAWQRKPAIGSLSVFKSLLEPEQQVTASVRSDVMDKVRDQLKGAV